MEKLRIAIIVKDGVVQDVLMSPAAEKNVEYVTVDLDEHGESVPGRFVDEIPGLAELADDEGINIVDDDDDNDEVELEDGSDEDDWETPEPDAMLTEENAQLTQEDAQDRMERMLREQGLL